MSPDIVRKRALRTGDGSHISTKETTKEALETKKVEFEEHVWGWQDEKMTESEKSDVTIYHKSN